VIRKGIYLQQAPDCQNVLELRERRDGHFHSDTPNVVAMCHLETY